MNFLKTATALAAFSPCPSPSSHAVVVVTMRCRRRRHASSSLSLHCHLAAPRAVVHHRCTVMPLSRRWIHRCRLPPSSLLCRLCCRAVGRHCRGAIGRRRRTIFASPGLPPSPLGVAVPCTRLAAPLCHPAASVCIVAPLCTAVVVMRGARALRSWRPFSGAVPGPWACRWGGGEGAAGAPCVWHAWLSSSQCAVVAVVGSSSRTTDVVRLCATPGRCSPVEGG